MDALKGDQDQQKSGLDKALLLDFRNQAHSALAHINDIRRGCNVTQDEIWGACETLDGLIAKLNKAIALYP